MNLRFTYKINWFDDYQPVHLIALTQLSFASSWPFGIWHFKPCSGVCSGTLSHVDNDIFFLKFFLILCERLFGICHVDNDIFLKFFLILCFWYYCRYLKA